MKRQTTMRKLMQKENLNTTELFLSLKKYIGIGRICSNGVMPRLSAMRSGCAWYLAQVMKTLHPEI